MVDTDPFQVKRLPKWHPRRVVKTLVAWIEDKKARWDYEKHRLPECVFEDLPDCPDFHTEDTAVTLKQMRHLLEICRRCTEKHQEGVFVEVGSYRGSTTMCLGKAVRPRTYVAVDPFMGWGGAEDDLRVFKQKTSGLENVVHERTTSGEAARSWQYGPIAFVFVDAVHNYWNTNFDLSVWSERVKKGGYIAAHDTDTKAFAGTRRAVYEKANTEDFEVCVHVPDLVILRKL